MQEAEEGAADFGRDKKKKSVRLMWTGWGGIHDSRRTFCPLGLNI